MAVISRARMQEILLTPYDQLTNNNIKRLRQYLGALRWKQSDYEENDPDSYSYRESPARRRTVAKWAKESSDVTHKLMLCGIQFQYVNDTLRATADCFKGQTTDGHAYMRKYGAGAGTIFDQEVRALTLLTIDNPWAVYGAVFQCRHKKSNDTEKLIAILEELLYLQPGAPPMPKSMRMASRYG